MATYTNLKPLSNDWQLYNYNPSSRDEYRGTFTYNPLMAQGQHAGPSMDGLRPEYWGDILNANADLLRQRGYMGSFDLAGKDATQGDVSGLVDWMKNAGLVVGQSGPLKDGSAKHGSYYTQLFDTSGGGYNPIGVGTQVTNDYGEEGLNLAKVALAALGGAALNGSFAAPTDGGTSIGLGGSMGGAGWAPSSVVNPAIGETVGQSIAASLGGTGAGTGLLSASGAGGGLLAGSADKAALLGNAGYGAGMSGNATAAFDAVAGLTGNNSLAAAAGNAMDGNLLNAAKNVGGNMDWTDWAKLGLQAFGAYQGAQEGKDKTQTVNRDPWGPAQPYILDALKQGQQLYQQYQANPFSQQQQTAYNNLGGLLNSINAGIPGLLGNMSANASGANNYDRANPRKALTGSNSTFSAFNPGLLNFFPPKG